MILAESIFVPVSGEEITIRRQRFYDMNSPIDKWYSAINIGDLDMMKFLIHDGVDINSTDTGSTALDLAVSNANVEMVKLLMNYPALDINKGELDGSPIFSVLYNINTDIGELHNLADQHSAKVRELALDLGKYLRTTKAQRPSYKSTGKPVPWPDEAL